MRILVLTALVVYSITITQAEVCRLKIPVTSSNLKCGDQIYHRDDTAIKAINECGAGKDGVEICLPLIKCVFEKIGMSKNSVLLKDKVAEASQKAFPHHHEAITKGLIACSDAYRAEDPHKTRNCLLKMYEDVCGHKTCDWFNTLD
ncbi:unnamed protein product [Allacma fusca]|uniref:Uncharacterized protein n=1 Tax=Allacma fusca TaxID=39272 RepID=A0A8J2JBT7_9HEXA|nr:unnamed protein product [Allacma fusca]